ncbi:MAG: choice-of-anchor J domain-containing protein [Candidatus Hodarchaeota archaeon]
MHEFNKGIKKGIVILTAFTVLCMAVVAMNNGGVDAPFNENNFVSIQNSAPITENTTVSAELNATQTWLNYTITLEAYYNYDFQLSFPSSCDFDLWLLDENSSNLVWSDKRELGSPIGDKNESFYYRSLVQLNCTINVTRYTGDGIFNLTVIQEWNNDPVLVSPGVAPNDTNASLERTVYETFNFSVVFTDPDGFDPTEINLVLDGIAYPMVNAIGSDPVAGVTYYLENSTMSQGVHNFYFNASDGIGTNATASDSVNVTGASCSLNNPAVDPNNGNPVNERTPHATFNFSVVYSHPIGIAPVEVNLVFNDSVAYPLTNTIGTNYTAGVIYYLLNSSMDVGSYSYRFNASDGVTTASTSSAILDVENSSVSLTSPGVIPNNGYLPEERTPYASFNFSVVYSNIVDVAPTEINLVLDGNVYPLSNTVGMDYIAGVTYYLVNATMTLGTHVYYFNATDGIVTNTTSSGSIDVENPNYSVLKATAELNATDTWINYTITIEAYYDYDFQLSFPSNCDFDLYLLDENSTELGRSDARMNGSVDGSRNETIYYRSFIQLNCTINVTRYAGAGIFNLTVIREWNHAPELVSPAVSPNNNDTAFDRTIFETFNFSVIFIDLNGYNPVEINLVLDGIAYPMVNTIGSDPVAGVTYYLENSTMTPVVHNFYFNVSDGIASNTTATDSVSVTSASCILNNAAVDPDNSSVVSEKTPHTTFNFSVVYSHTIGIVPVEINLVLDGIAYPMTNTTGTNYTTGVTYYYLNSSMTVGSHVYRFNASDGLTTYSTISYDYDVENSSVSLTSPGVNPDNGFPSAQRTPYASFNFSVVYSNIVDVAPTAINLVLDGIVYPLNDSIGTDYVAGVIYYLVNSSMVLGNHTYYFNASDDVVTNMTSSDNLTVANTSVSLTSPGVNPDNGFPSAQRTPYASFNFSVVYSNIVDVAPTAINLVLDGIVYPLNDSIGTDYVAGVTYYLVNSSMVLGNHTYYFNASDIIGTKMTSTYNLSVANSTVLLNAPSVDPSDFDPAIDRTPHTTFNFSVVYINPSNFAPNNVSLILDNVTYLMTSTGGSDYTTGVTYYYENSSMTLGTHIFYFYAEDDLVTNTTSSDNVTVTSPYLILNNPSVSPNNTALPGDRTIFDTFNFSVVYQHPLGIAPDSINVTINGSVYSLANIGTNYTAGVTYYALITGLAQGTNNFYFNASDGIASNNTSGSPGSVDVTAPASLPIYTNNPYLETFDQLYNNALPPGNKWTNTTNSAPWGMDFVQFQSSLTSIFLAANETLGGGGTTGYLISPLFDLTGDVNFQLTFAYRLVGTYIPFVFTTTAYIQAERNISGTWAQLGGDFDIDGEWHRVVLNISQYEGDYVRFRFYFDGIVGGANVLNIDDFHIKKYVPGNNYINWTVVKPSSHEYTTFQVDVTLSNDQGNFPSLFYIGIYVAQYYGLSQANRRMMVDLIEVDPDNYNIIAGKDYTCSFQVFDYDPVYLYVFINDEDAGYTYIERLDDDKTGDLADAVTYPFELDFESGGYYIIDDYATGRVGVTGGQFSTGGLGDPYETGDDMRLGFVTRKFNLTSTDHVIMEFYHEMIDLGGTFTLDISFDGGHTFSTYETFSGYEAGATISRNITQYKGNVVCFRFLLVVAPLEALVGTEWIIDNFRVYDADLTAPVIASVSVKKGEWIRTLWNPYNLEVYATDVGNGLDRIIVQIGSKILANESMTSSPKQVSLDVEGVPNGMPNLSITVFDKDGNQVSFLIQVKIDNTPYELIFSIIGIVSVIAISLIVKLRKDAAKAGGFREYVKKQTVEREVEPPKEVIDEILAVTSIFRKLTVDNLIKKMHTPSITPARMRSFLRYCLNNGIIKGSLEGDVFIREIGGKKEALPIKLAKVDFVGELDKHKTEIIKYLKIKAKTSINDLQRKFKLQHVDPNMIENYILDVIRSSSLPCYFEDGFFINEDVHHIEEEVIKQAIDDPTKGKAIGILSTHDKYSLEDLKEQLGVYLSVKELGDFVEKWIKDGELDGILEKDVFITRKEPEIVEKKDELIKLLKSRPRISFDEINKGLGIKSSHDEIEDIIVDLIYSGDVKGNLTGKIFIGAKPGIKERRDEVIEYLKSRDETTFEGLKQALGLPDSLDDIEDFLFGLIKVGIISGMLEDDKFVKD